MEKFILMNFLAPTLTNIAKVEEWLRNLDSFVQIGEKAYKDAIQKVFLIYRDGAQIIFITASGLLCRYHNLQNMIIKNVYKSGQSFWFSRSACWKIPNNV